MRYWLSIFIMFSMHSFAGQPGPLSIQSVAWLVGSWKGTLGPQTVEETWSSPEAGSIEAMIRVSSAAGIEVLEFIVIRETQTDDAANSLALHLRQFDPALKLRNSQDLQLSAISTDSVSFAAEVEAGIQQLVYTNTGQGRLQVDVHLAGGESFSAFMERQ